MSIVLNVPDDIAVAAQDLAKRSGLDTGQVLLDALRVHFPAIPPELQAEFAALEAASDADFARLTRTEGL